MKFDDECVYPELLFTVKIRYQIYIYSYFGIRNPKNTSPELPNESAGTRKPMQPVHYKNHTVFHGVAPGTTVPGMSYYRYDIGRTIPVHVYTQTVEVHGLIRAAH